MAITDNINKLQSLIGYEFKDLTMITVALSHPGLKKGNKSSVNAFERLEFLGDRVLGLSLCDFLYNNFKSENEGTLAIRMATLAGTDFLIDLAKKTKIIDCFCIPKDFFISNKKNSSSIADMMEAVFGAVFLDSDFKSVQTVIVNLWKNDFNKAIYKTKDAKTRLQEMVQAQTSDLPTYRLVQMKGEAHNPTFEVEVCAYGKVTLGCGNSKKHAEHNAAEKMIALLSLDKNHCSTN